MANITLAWNNRTDSGTLSGGSWLATLPITNLQNRQVQKVARSSNALTSSTQFTIDLGQARTIGAVALVVHNISVSGNVRISGSDSAITNRLLDPSDFTSANWAKYGSAPGVGVTVTANVSTAPDGTLTADRVDVASIALGVTLRQSITSTTGSVQFGVYVRQVSGTATSCNIDVGDSGVVFSSVALSSAWTKIVCSGAVTGATYVDISFAGLGVFDVWGAELFDGSGAVYDSGWAAVWPSGMIPQSLLEWEEDNFWLGTLSSNARAGYQSPFIYLLSAAQTARYWKVEVSDTSNGDGYVQIGRLFMASTWVPSVNYAYGAGLGYQDPSPIDVSLSGAEYFDVRSRFRLFDFELDYILGTEAYSNALELQRLSGTSGEVLLVPDSEDAVNQPARAFVGRLTQLGQITQPQANAFAVKFQVKELL